MRLTLWFGAALLSTPALAHQGHHGNFHSLQSSSSLIDITTSTSTSTSVLSNSSSSTSVPSTSSNTLPSLAARTVAGDTVATADLTHSTTTGLNLTNPYTEQDYYSNQIAALWGRNNSVSVAAQAMLALASGADYDFYREDDVANLAASVSILFSNMTAAEANGLDQSQMPSYLASVADYLKGVTHVVNDNVGGSTRNDTLQELGYSLQVLAKASEVLDGFQKGNSSLEDYWMTADDRSGLVTAWKAIMDYSINTVPQWSDSSFNYYSFTGACAAAEEITRLASVYSFDVDVSTYLTWVDGMFHGFFYELPGAVINTAAPVSFKVDNRTEMWGGDNALYLSWGDWDTALSGVDVTIEVQQGSGTMSDSAGYLIEDLINLGSALLMLQGQTGNDTLSTYLDPSYSQAFASIVEYYTALFIGVVDSNTGFMPPYGDANWGDDGTFDWTLMEIAATLVKTLDPEQASRLKYYSNMAARFTLDWEGSSYPQLWRHSLTNAWDVVATAPSASNVTESSILYRQSTWGTSIESKVALRGSDSNLGTNGICLVNTLSTDSFGHSHSVAGSIVAHAYDSSILLRSLGYAASYDVFQNNLVVRRTPDSKTSFLSYEQLSGTEDRLSPVQAYKWSATELADTMGITGNVMQTDTDSYAYTAITRQVMTGKGQASDDEYNFHLFHHTRQIVMDKSKGALFVYDSIRPNETIEAGVFSFGQLFHVAEILSNVSTSTSSDTLAVVGQNGPYFETQDSNQQRGKPFLLQMAGGDKRETVWWSFDASMATYADGW